MKKLSLIIPTYQRPLEIERKLYHLNLQQCKCAIIIIDSSSNKNLTKNKQTIKIYKKKLNIKYFIVSTKVHFAEKIFLGICKVKTKFSVITFDDDFLNLSAVESGINFLENNSDYSNASGYILNHIKGKKNSPSRVPILGKFDIFDDNDPITRCENFLKSEKKRNLLFNVWNTSLLKSMFKPVSKITWKKYSELLFDFVAVSSGKSKFIDDIFEVRTSDYDKVNYRSHGLPGFTSSFFEDFNDKNFYPTFRTMIDIAANFVKKQSNISKLEAVQKIGNFYLLLRLKKILDKKNNSFKFYSIIHRIFRLFLRLRYLFTLIKPRNFLILIDVFRNYKYHDIGLIFNKDSKLNFCYYSLANSISPYCKSYEHIRTAIKKYPN